MMEVSARWEWQRGIASGQQMGHGFPVQTLQLSEAKAKLGRIADDALAGKPVLIRRKGKLLSLVAYQPPETVVREPGYFRECYADEAEQRREAKRVRATAYRKAEA